MLREGGGLVAGGILVGVTVAWWTGRLVSGYIFNVSAHDPLVLGFSIATVAGLALLATLIPARRAISLQLGRALRGD